MSARLPRAPETFEQLVLAFLSDLGRERGLARNTVQRRRLHTYLAEAITAHQHGPPVPAPLQV
jgi:hypothetical protein